MIEARKGHLFGQTKKLANLDSGRQTNQKIIQIWTVYILLARRMGTLGMTCHVITATISVVFKVRRKVSNGMGLVTL